MGRPSESERFVEKALGLIKIGASEAFNSRWGETIHQVRQGHRLAKMKFPGSHTDRPYIHVQVGDLLTFFRIDDDFFLGDSSPRIGMSKVVDRRTSRFGLFLRPNL